MTGAAPVTCWGCRRVLIERRPDGYWYEAGTDVRHTCPAEVAGRETEAEDAERVWRALVAGEVAEDQADGDGIAEASWPRWLRWLRRLLEPAEPEAA